MGTKMTTSVVGGGSGGKLSMRGLNASDRFELVAAVDLNPEVCTELEKLYPGIKTFTSHAEMFEKCPTEVVCVSTYAPTHEPITMDALDKLPLKGILVEKPLGDTAAAGRRIIDAIKARNLPMAVPHGMLARKATLEVLQRIHNNEIGNLKLVEIQCAKWDIINAGIHWMNYFVNLTNLAPMDYVMTTCENSTRTYRDGMQVETTAVTYAVTKNDIRAVMNTGDEVMVDGKNQGILFRIIGDAGMIIMPVYGGAYTILNAKYPGGETIKPEEMPVTGHQYRLEEMAGMIDSGKPDYAIPESSQIALEICEAAYLANRKNCKVTFPLDKFTPPAQTDWDPGMPYSGSGGGRDGRKL